jgi:hypothetical protein
MMSVPQVIDNLNFICHYTSMIQHWTMLLLATKHYAIMLIKTFLNIRKAGKLSSTLYTNGKKRHGFSELREYLGIILFSALM